MMTPHGLQDRYFVVQEIDRTWSICDRDIVEVERNHRIVTSLTPEHAIRLLRKLNEAQSEAVL